MPELPEVETIVRGLAPTLTGRRVEAAWTSGRPLHLARPVDVRGLRAVAVGRTIVRVRRAGKFIVLETDGGVDTGVLVHLGMTGRLRVQPSSIARAPHTHVVLRLDGGDELRFVDPRRFGWVAPGQPLSAVGALAQLGPDALDALDVATLAAALRGARTPVKAFLLDQRRMAGVGNIYASEALFRAGIRPTTPAARAAGRAPALLAGLREALAQAIARRGTSMRDYVDANGLPGDNAAALLVYGRATQPCVRCGEPIRRRVDAGRATFYCPRCQR